MRYQISGKQIDIGESLQQFVQEELGGILDKYAERPTDAQVVFSKDGHEYMCESTIHLSTGLTVNSSAKATEIYGAFEKSGERVEKQLRRYKRRLKDHANQRTTPIESFNASSYIVAADDESEAAGLEGDAPIIVAEMETSIKSLSVSEAVMQMELADEPVLVFKNEKGEGLNIVYRRSDGNIGWIDPQNMHAG
ncbi:MAG: ribosome-associated translation inhibitor RaiA [Pseudomonadota bacterium]